MKRFLYPVLFLMACIPDSNKHLESFNAVAQAAHYTVKNIKDGLDSFQSSIVKFNEGLNQPVAKKEEAAGQAKPAEEQPANENI